MTTHTQHVERTIIVRPSKAEGRAYRDTLRTMRGAQLWDLYRTEHANPARCWFADMVMQELTDRARATFPRRKAGHQHRYDRSHKLAAWEV